MSSKIEIERVCEYCNSKFIAKTTKTKYCSHRCNQRDYKRRAKEKKINSSHKETAQKINKPLFDIKEKPYLNVKETAILLGCSVRTIYRLIEQKNINAVNLGQRVTRIKQEEINNLFKN